MAAEIRKTSNKEILNRTVRAMLLEAVLTGCKARKQPYVYEINKKKWLMWGKEHQDSIYEDQVKMVWSE